MKAFSVNPQTQELKEIDISMGANTIYSFFNSIAIDESLTIDKHTIYLDANVIDDNKKPYFMGGQIFMGDALIFGKDGYEDIEPTIPKDELELLIDYRVNKFYLQSLELLSKTESNLYKSFEVIQKHGAILLSIDWVLHTFSISDDKTQEYFLSEMKKASQSDEKIGKFISKMAQLAVNSI